jgi:anti-anti-sigma regulatory factor
MTAPPPADPEDRGPAAPKNEPSPHALSDLVAASHLITGAADKQALVDGLVKILAPHAVKSFELLKLEGSSAPDVEIAAVWDARGKPPVELGARYPREAYPGLDNVPLGPAVLFEDCLNDPSLPEATRAILAELGIRAASVYPTIAHGELTGALVIKFGAPHKHTPEEKELFGLVAQLAGVGLINVESRAALARQIARVSALYRAGEELAAVADEGALLQTAADLLVDDIGYITSWIATVDEGSDTLRERAIAGTGVRPGHVPTRYSIEDREVASVEVFRTASPMILTDAAERAEIEGWGAVARAANLRTAFYVPLRAAGKTLGVLGIGTTEARVRDEEVTLLCTFGNQLALSISRAQMSAEREKQIASMEQMYFEQVRLLETVRELSTPVIPVHDGILVVPLVGTIDEGRSAQITEAMLDAIQRDRAEVVILDITGVPTVDTGVANHLLRATRAAALLGASCLLVGISPVVARTLVALGIDLSDITTRNNLQAGIAYALARMDLEIRRVVRR